MDVVSISPEAITDGDAEEHNVDCLVVDSTDSTADAAGILDSIGDRTPSVPAIVLVEAWDTDEVSGAFRAGATAVLPRRLVDSDPDVLAERVADAVGRDRARESFQELYDSIASIATLHDPETGELRHANRALCDLLGYDRDELLSMRLGDLTAEVPGYDQERVTQIVASVTDRDEPIEVEWPMSTADGAVRWVESRLRPTSIGGQDVVLNTSLDVTERRRQERKYQQVFDSVNDAITVHDPWAERLVDVNETLAEVTGYSRDALIEMGVDGFSAAESGFTGDRAYEIQRQVAATGESETVDWVVETASGEQRRFECVLSPATIAGEDRVLVLGRDVTERRRLEETYRELFENVSDGLVIHDPESGEILDVNDRFCEMNGYERDELVDETVDLISADDHSFGSAQDRIRAAREEGPQLFEWRNRRKNGETFPVEVHLSVVDIRGEERVLGSVRDITERKRREQAYEQIFNGVHDPITVHDPETAELLEVNDAFCEILGYDREEIIEMGIEGYTPDEMDYTMADAREFVHEVVETGEPKQTEWAVETRDGETRWLEVKGTTVEIGGELRYVSIDRDITERRRREREYQQIFDGVHDAIVVHDPETAEMVDVNDSFCELMGYDRERILELGTAGVSVEEAGYTEERAEEIIDRVMEEGEVGPFEWQVETKDGERRILEVRATQAEIGGETRHVSLNRDVTERRRREREYEQIFNGVTEAIVLQDPETAEPVDANQAFLDRLGYDDVEAIREAGLEGLSATEDGFTREKAQEICQRVVETGDPETAEWQQETRDGERRWIEAKVDVAEIRGEELILSLQRDVTERKRREQMIRALHDATDRLHSADSRDEVCQAAVDAATDVLDLSMPAVWVRDTDGSAVLRPAAGTVNTQSASPDGFGAFEPGDFEYDVYERGETRVYDPSDRDEETTLESAFLVPLGEHGLLGAADRGADSFDDVTLDGAQLLARHVTSALGRVERARELRESERRFRLIAEHIDEIVYLATADFSEILYINPVYEEIYGRPVEELSEDPTSFVEAAHPDDRDRYEADVERLVDDLEAGTPQDAYHGEYRIQRDGETRWVTVTRFPVENDDGTVDRVVGRVQDVTERQRREREYEQIFNGVNDAITVFHPETGGILNVNETYHEMLGYDDLDRIRELGIEGLSVTEKGYTGEKGRDLIRDVAETGEPQTVEWRGETKDGDRLWLEATLAAVEIGGEQRVLSMQRDVTERKRREREYQQIFDGVTDAITIHDPDTGDIVDLNETMCELTGYDGEELLDAGMESINVPEEGYGSERARRIIEEIMATGEQRTLEWLIERKDAERRWIEINATPAEIGGEERYLSIMRDVTDQRRTERRLREILERIDEAIYLTRATELTTPTLSDDDLYAGYESIWGESLDGIFERYDSGFFDTLHPDEESGFREFIDGIGADLDDGTVSDRYTREYRIVRADGELRWIRSDFYPIEWPTGSLRVVIVSRDITERKSRERRIASFDDATDDLATADTSGEATRTAVEAAVETLNLPAVGAFLYDGDDGVLRPEVLAGPLPDEVATDPIGPGDGPLWEGFATGTVVASDGGHSDAGFVGEDAGGPSELADLEEWRALALGQHGILLVGAPDAALDAEAIQAAHVLAATLEAALNHLEGQQQLAAQEEQLRAQTQRAERLDRIARLTQQVEAAITDATDPGEIERAVCERLASSGPYDLAWVGGVEAGSDRLTPHAVVGAPTQYVDGMDLATSDDTADPHPAVAAWRTDEAQVADSIVGDGPTGAWRRQVLSEGFQSLCAVPLTYDGITHGVLTVATDSPNAFGERERDVLAQLATSIANALAAIERRRALESDETIELEFQGPGSALSIAQAADAADCRVTLERTVARQDGSVSVYVSFDDGEESLDVARRTLPGSVEPVTDDTDSTLVETRTDDWFGSPLAEYGGVLREATADSDETVVTVEVPQQADVRSFVERLQDVAPSLELVARRQHSQRDRTPAELGDRLETELTDRQFEVLQTALTAGYFEWPRENDGSDVADRLGITQPTLNKHLRLAEKKTFSLLFEAED